MKASEGSRESTSQITLSATQIDNERLQEQLRHYSERCTKLEEKLEDARATLERDGHAYQEKIAQLRHDDGQRKKDLATKTKEVEQLMKSESLVRLRVEEIEEALRESTVALENTRAELEMLRAELAVIVFNRIIIILFTSHAEPRRFSRRQWRRGYLFQDRSVLEKSIG